MKVILDGREYRAVTPDDITLADLMAIKRATGMTRPELNEMSARVQALSEAEQQQSDEALVLAGIQVWLARRHAGEVDLSLEQACDIPMAKVAFVREPGDPDPEDVGSGLGPTRRGSAPGAARAPQDRKVKKTSSKKSSAASR